MDNKGRKTQAKLEPYKERVNNFFKSLKTTEIEWYNELKNAYPAIDIDFALKRSKLWLSTNYKKDFKKFLMNWMSKENPSIQIEQKKEEQNEDNPNYAKKLKLQEAFKSMEARYKKDSDE